MSGARKSSGQAWTAGTSSKSPASMQKRKQALAAKLGVNKNSGIVKKSKAAAGSASKVAGRTSGAAQQAATATKEAAAASAATAAQGAAASAATAAQHAATAVKSAAAKAAKSAQKVRL